MEDSNQDSVDPFVTPTRVTLERLEMKSFIDPWGIVIVAVTQVSDMS